MIHRLLKSTPVALTFAAVALSFALATSALGQADALGRVVREKRVAPFPLAREALEPRLQDPPLKRPDVLVEGDVAPADPPRQQLGLQELVLDLLAVADIALGQERAQLVANGHERFLQGVDLARDGLLRPQDVGESPDRGGALETYLLKGGSHDR